MRKQTIAWMQNKEKIGSSLFRVGVTGDTNPSGMPTQPSGVNG
jgi:hypothetical protein